MKPVALILTALLSLPCAAAAPEPPADQPVDPAEVPSPFRLGASFGAGVHVPFPALALAVEGHLGAQFTPVVAAYLSVAGNLGVGNNSLNHFVVSALFEATLRELFFLAFGPAVAVGRLAVTAPGSASPLLAEGFKPALDLRLGFCTGRPDAYSHSRTSLSIGLETLVMFHPNAHPEDAPGAARQLLVAVTPVVFVGVDFNP